MNKIKPAIWGGAYPSRIVAPEEAIKRIARIGWRYLELHPDYVQKIDPYKLRKLCEDLGISTPQMHGYEHGMALNSHRESKEHMKRAKRLITWAGAAGVKWVVIHPDNPKGTTLCIGMKPNQIEEVKKRNLEGFRELSETARTAGVGIALENLPDHIFYRVWHERWRLFGSRFSELIWLVENVDPNLMGICLDTNHICHRIDNINQYEAIKLCGQYLVATHISDNHGLTEQHLLPFEGNIDWKAVMDGLNEVGYNGLFCIEAGGSIGQVPLSVRDELLRYTLKLVEEMIEGRI
ncbi:sugar phosphate isomerase/epimerase [Candidatus Aerophobetes bacterium]|nr:sugar phosphate isomerase/epimerase [Candidatus Aerophobetes bacterium]